MAKDAIVGLQDFTISPQLLSYDEQSIIRSVVFVRSEMPNHVLRNQRGTTETGEFEQIMTVTDLLDHGRYLVKPIESGYRLFFPLNEGEVIVELASEADLPTIAHDLGRRFAELGIHAF